MAEGTFVTAVNCMDGRTQLPIIEYMTKRYGVDYVDMVTEPGPIKFLAENDEATVASIRRRIEISVNKHGSKVCAIIGHDDCGGNPVDRSTQEAQIHKALALVKSWGLGIDWIGLYIKDNATVEQVA
ncbi:MAG: hypothetical protein JW763_03690 [candidate division Zixibacteria bacterium]|nr:hypothetical protein [candidate division Zixibacteria bacterium]